MTDKINKALDYNGPFICIVELPECYIFSPKLSSYKKPDGKLVSKPLEDMYPFLERQEFLSNMIIPVQEE